MADLTRERLAELQLDTAGMQGHVPVLKAEFDALLAMASRAVSEETIGKLAESLVVESKWVTEGCPHNCGSGPENTAARRVFENRVRGDLHEATVLYQLARDAEALAKLREQG